MRQPRFLWLGFALAVGVVLASMGWVTAAVLRLDAAEAESQRRAQLEENVRLALWRMDSALAPLIAAEHARPAGAVTDPVSAPLPGTETPFVRAYFRLSLDTPGQPAPVPSYEQLAAALPAPDPSAAPEAEAFAQAPVKGGKAQRGYQEYQARAANTMQQVEVQQQINRSAFPATASVSFSALRPVWLGDELLLARRVAGARGESIQCCRIDWGATRAWLLQSVTDLLPRARLVPAATEDAAAQPDVRLLASLPVRLESGPLPASAEPPATSPLRVSLVIAWACVLTATAAVGLLLAGVASLSERRGAFVSAVTHELRTPLTTLRMYTEMLSEGMVADEMQRSSYLATLRAEADRLGHLVENILAYSRLERNRAGYEPAEVTLGDAISRTVERLADRARQAGMALQADLKPEVLSVRVRTNALALEQILFNLVDNACKYAAGVTDRTIGLSAAAAGDAVLLTVRDHGPGLAAARSSPLFRPFAKSVQEAANSAPGLGLGLALSRRLARSMGGDLRLDPGITDGAAFVVTLLRAER